MCSIRFSDDGEKMTEVLYFNGKARAARWRGGRVCAVELEDITLNAGTLQYDAVGELVTHRISLDYKSLRDSDEGRFMFPNASFQSFSWSKVIYISHWSPG